MRAFSIVFDKIFVRSPFGGFALLCQCIKLHYRSRVEPLEFLTLYIPRIARERVIFVRVPCFRKYKFTIIQIIRIPMDVSRYL